VCVLGSTTAPSAAAFGRACKVYRPCAPGQQRWRWRSSFDPLERGDLKLRVRALEAERALARVQIMQSVMACTVVACTLVNMGTILSVNAMARAATASFAGAGLTSVLTLVNWLKVKNLEKKEAQLVGSG